MILLNWFLNCSLVISAYRTVNCNPDWTKKVGGIRYYVMNENNVRFVFPFNEVSESESDQFI